MQFRRWQELDILISYSAFINILLLCCHEYKLSISYIFSITNPSPASHPFWCPWRTCSFWISFDEMQELDVFFHLVIFYYEETENSNIETNMNKINQKYTICSMLIYIKCTTLLPIQNIHNFKKFTNCHLTATLVMNKTIDLHILKQKKIVNFFCFRHKNVSNKWKQ